MKGILGRPSDTTRLRQAMQPGDVIRLDEGEYVGVKTGAHAVIDGSHFMLDFEDGNGPVVLAVFGASAFRGPSSAYAADQTPYVSCSGGPCPFVRVKDLTWVGTIDRLFWRWMDRPRADGGENYMLTVNLWSWRKS